MVITISGQTATSDLRINAPTRSEFLSDYLIDLINDNDLDDTPEVLSISLPTTATGNNLTSFGRTNAGDGFEGTAWRLRNGTPVDENGTLTAFGIGDVNTYELPSDTDTFVISPEATGSATHIFEVDGTSKTKAASSDEIKITLPIGGESYKIIGGSGDDTLRGRREDDELIGRRGDDLLVGRRGDDLLVGRRGDDTLTGGAGGDRFRFNNRGVDVVTDFNADEGDVFQIRTGNYPGANSEITIDTLANIISSSGDDFAYATDTNQLLYDDNNNWSDGSTVIATVTNLGSTPTLTNFDFI